MGKLLGINQKHISATCCQRQHIVPKQRLTGSISYYLHVKQTNGNTNDLYCFSVGTQEKCLVSQKGCRKNSKEHETSKKMVMQLYIIKNFRRKVGTVANSCHIAQSVEEVGLTTMLHYSKKQLTAANVLLYYEPKEKKHWKQKLDNHYGKGTCQDSF